jgi:hypothetical protein
MKSPLLDHLFTPEPDLPSENHDLIKKQISKFAKVGCQLAIVAGMPSKLKIYLDALLSISDGNDEFEANNADLARYICNNRNITEESAAREITRYATAFFNWQNDARIEFVHRVVGHMDMATGKKHKSKFKVPVLNIIAEILKKGGWNQLTKFDQTETLDSLRTTPDKLSGVDDQLDDIEASVRELNRNFFLAGNRPTQEYRSGRSRSKRRPEWDLKASLTLATKAVGNCTFSSQEEHLLRDLKAVVDSALAGFSEIAADDGDVPQSTAKDNSVPQRINTEGTEKGSRGGVGKDSSFSDPIEPEPPFVEKQTPGARPRAASEAAPDKSPPRDPKKESLEVPLLALEAFKSVGTESFFSMYKCEATGKLISEFTRSAERFENELHTYFFKSEGEKVSFCVRPKVDHLIQLDDLTEADVNLLQPVSFLSVETSPGNYQSWIALDADSSARRSEIRRQLIGRLRELGSGVDESASGSLRFPGFRNFKSKYRDAGFPRVKVTAVKLGNRVLETILSDAGLLLPPPVLHPPANEVSSKFKHSSKSPTVFPSWERECISLTSNGAVDRSKADFRWCMIASAWGWSQQEIRAELRRVSPLAAEESERYVERTVRRAAERVNGA